MSALAGNEHVSCALDQHISLSAVERSVASIGSILGYCSEFVGRKMLETFPSRPVNGGPMVVVFDANHTALHGENEVFFHFGYNGWQVRIKRLHAWVNFITDMLGCRTEFFDSENDAMSSL